MMEATHAEHPTLVIFIRGISCVQPPPLLKFFVVLSLLQRRQHFNPHLAHTDIVPY